MPGCDYYYFQDGVSFSPGRSGEPPTCIAEAGLELLATLYLFIGEGNVFYFSPPPLPLLKHYAALAGFELTEGLLPLSPECWH